MTAEQIVWDRLAKDWERLKPVHLRELFALDTDRFSKFALTKDDLTIDFSKERLDAEAWGNLVGLAEACNVEAKRDAMFAGEHINSTEDRAVMHVALRAKAVDGYTVDGQPTASMVDEALDKFLSFADAVRAGEITNARGQKFTDVVNIGIGGSDLGPVMAVKALTAYGKEGPNLHFLANIDGNDFEDTFANLEPATTLVLVASKTFTTIETMTNAKTAKSWLLSELSEDEVGSNLAALSTNLSATQEFGIDDSHVFGFWDWVGGRYSMCAAIGLPIALAVGAANFREMLDGFRDMDLHFKSAPLESNLPVMLALVGVWRRNIMKAPTVAIMPYDQRLDRFPAYVKQMDMESNGKSISLAGERVSHQTAPVIWGEAGTNAQHSFFQLIHQGTDIVPVDFMIAAKANHGLAGHHEKLMANVLAQSEALAFGKAAETALAEMLDKGIDKDRATELAPHRRFDGNKPSTTIVYKEITPFTFGRLVALYEHKVFVQGAIWNINSFDQWGVELGKVAAVNIGRTIEGDASIADLHDATQPLLSLLNTLGNS
jgi:glucose-6-phosphate isomerase